MGKIEKHRKQSVSVGNTVQESEATRENETQWKPFIVITVTEILYV